jgi:23S rRNA pseudouridine1911/1915/1917 synthase
MNREPKIIYQDESILVLDKPSGWITNDADTTTTQPVVQKWLRENFDYPLTREDREYRDGIVHRLDKETSGILIVAKTRDSFEKFQKEFKERRVGKTYIALLHGKVSPSEGEIKATVGRLPWRRDRFGILPGGRESETHYRVIENFDNYSLVEFKPKTGRTHQIRIHAKYIGHPVVGDEFYAGRKTAREDRKWCPRLFLHAGEINVLNNHFKSDLPSDLKTALLTLRH